MNTMQTPTQTTGHYIPKHLKRWTRASHYVGATWSGYFVAPVTQNRDSGVLDRTNWDSQFETLKAFTADVPDSDESSPMVVSENHWAVGWVEWLAIHESNHKALKAADELAERLENCPVLDEDALSENESEEANQVWKVCYRDKERMEYVRKHRGQFEFQSFGDMLSCLRGKYFCGYASELIN